MLMDSLFDRIRRSIAQRGLIGTGRMCWWNLRELVMPTSRSLEAGRRRTDIAFDQENGVETAGIVRPKAQAVIGRNWAYGIRYQAIDPAAFIQTLKRISIRYREFTFVDYGSGKGRALLLACRFPFKKIIGIEYCEKLNQIARRNLHRLSSAGERERIEIVHADAARHPVPDGPVLLYFFNPFGLPVMADVVRNAVESFRRAPRRMIVVYFTPWFDHLWAATGFFRRLQTSPAVFDSEPNGISSGEMIQTVTE